MTTSNPLLVAQCLRIWADCSDEYAGKFAMGGDSFVKLLRTKADELEASAPAPEPAEAKLTVTEALETIDAAMREDLEYAWSWHCNVAMAFVDEGGDHDTANRAAARFMGWLFPKLDTTKHPGYKAKPKPAEAPAPALSDEEWVRLKVEKLCPVDAGHADIKTWKLALTKLALESVLRGKGARP